MQPGAPGSSGRICSGVAALSSTTRTRRPASSDRYNPARSSTCAGICRSSTPSARSAKYRGPRQPHQLSRGQAQGNHLPKRAARYANAVPLGGCGPETDQPVGLVGSRQLALGIIGASALTLCSLAEMSNSYTRISIHEVEYLLRLSRTGQRIAVEHFPSCWQEIRSAESAVMDCRVQASPTAPISVMHNLSCGYTAWLNFAAYSPELCELAEVSAKTAAGSL